LLETFDGFAEDIHMQIVSSLAIALSYTIVISIPVFIVITLFRGTKSNGEVADTQKDKRRLLEEMIAEQNKTNDLLRDQKNLWLDMAQIMERAGSPDQGVV
jgi:beta-lactamase regulating signal transducer with metallopeptidase domain